jgi:hypothetical protein
MTYGQKGAALIAAPSEFPIKNGLPAIMMFNNIPHIN